MELVSENRAQAIYSNCDENRAQAIYSNCDGNRAQSIYSNCDLNRAQAIYSNCDLNGAQAIYSNCDLNRAQTIYSNCDLNRAQAIYSNCDLNRAQTIYSTCDENRAQAIYSNCDLWIFCDRILHNTYITLHMVIVILYWNLPTSHQFNHHNYKYKYMDNVYFLVTWLLRHQSAPGQVHGMCLDWGHCGAVLYMAIHGQRLLITSTNTTDVNQLKK